MSRLGKMPNWQKWFVTFGLLTCSISGSMYLLGHQFHIYRSVLGSHSILATHGVTAMLAILAIGSVLPFHLKAGLKSGRKRISGFGQLSFLSLLVSSGALLYYGPEVIRDITVNIHWCIGLLFMIVFVWHAILYQKQT